MLLRFRSRLGLTRVSCEQNETFRQVVERWLGILNITIDPQTLTVSDGTGNTKSVADIAHKDIQSLGLKHGDILTMNYQVIDEYRNEEASNNISAVNITNGKGKVREQGINELPVDISLEKKNGLIHRKRSALCRHGDKGMCEYCSPLPPWDKGYQDENNIKHTSFHAYLKQLNEVTNKKSSGSSYIHPLSEPSYKINLNCPSGHEPWPKGICSKCQPSAVTLQQQSFRMVDHVEFQQSELVNQFIESWRTTGMQRFAYLYGYYTEYDNVPLGIKAVVEAIWEPSQHDEQDGLTMDMTHVKEEVALVDKLAGDMGLMKVGMIFTDLTDTGKGDGSVFCKRHKDSFFLSSLEVIMAAKHQLENKNISKYSSSGLFSSKFVTCVVSGNSEGEIDVSSYQVSTEAEALVDNDMITGSTYPSQAYINETNEKRYVPEIFYMKKNEYNLTVKHNAKPAFPVEYLLVSLTHGFPKDPEVLPRLQTASGFPWCNRQALGHSQDYMEVKRYIYSTATSGDFNELQKRLSNFHFLLYLHSLDILSSSEWSLVTKVATCPDDHELLFKLIASPGWQTLIMILEQSM